jgi:hypothetical protein
MFYIYIILGILVIHCTMYYLNIDIFQLLARSKCENANANVRCDNVRCDKVDTDKVDTDKIIQDSDTDTVSPAKLNGDDLSMSIETSINELKNLNQYIDNELGQTTFR